MCLVSIIIPTYNRLWSLPKAVNSCRDQGLSVEIIVIDDGSTDGTSEWLAEQQDLVVIRQNNQGKDHAVNNGMLIAKGKYVRFLDSDDWLLAGSTAELVSKAKQNDLDIVCAGYQINNDEGTLLKEIPWTHCDDFLAQQLGECDSSHYSAYLFRKSFIADIPHRQEFGSVDDRQFVIEVAFKYPAVGHVDVPTLAHRVHNRGRLQDATGMQKTNNHLAYLNIFNQAIERLSSESKLQIRYKRAIASKLWDLAHWMADERLDDAAKIYDMVFELDPHFKPKYNLSLAKMYNMLGFKMTERLLKIKRKIGN